MNDRAYGPLVFAHYSNRHPEAGDADASYPYGDADTSLNTDNADTDADLWIIIMSLHSAHH